MPYTFDDSYKRYINAQNEQADEKYDDVRLCFEKFNDTQKIDYLKDVMKNDDVELFEYLLRTHKNDVISICDDKESTLLHHAAMNNHPFYVYILTKQDGIDLDDYNCYDQTPLMLACSYGHKDVIKVLLRYEHKLELIDSIDIAHLSEQQDVLEMLLSEQEDRQAMSMFRKIRQAQDDMKKSKYLQEYDECATCDKKLVFMNRIMEKNEMDIFKMVLELRKDIVTSRDEDDWTILHNAVMLNHPTAVSLLLKEKAIDIDAVDLTQQTPLMLGCRAVRFKEVVRLLLEGGSDVLLKDNCGWNALDIAKRAKQRDILKLLSDFLEEKGLKDTGKLAGEYF